MGGWGGNGGADLAAMAQAPLIVAALGPIPFTAIDPTSAPGWTIDGAGALVAPVDGLYAGSIDFNVGIIGPGQKATCYPDCSWGQPFEQAILIPDPASGTAQGTIPFLLNLLAGETVAAMFTSSAGVMSIGATIKIARVGAHSSLLA